MILTLLIESLILVLENQTSMEPEFHSYNSKTFLPLFRRMIATVYQLTNAGEHSLYSQNGPSVGIKYKTGFTTTTPVPDMYLLTAAAQFTGYDSTVTGSTEPAA